MVKYFPLVVFIGLVCTSCLPLRVNRQLSKCKTVEFTGIYKFDQLWDDLKGQTSILGYELRSTQPTARGNYGLFSSFLGVSNEIWIRDLLPKESYRLSFSFDSTAFLPEFFAIIVTSTSYGSDYISGYYMIDKSEVEKGLGKVTRKYTSTGQESGIRSSVWQYPSMQEITSTVGELDSSSIQKLIHSNNSKSKLVIDVEDYVRQHSLDPFNIQNDSLKSIINSLDWRVFIKRITFEEIEPEDGCGEILVKYDPNENYY